MKLAIIFAADSGEPIDDARSIHEIWPADAELIYGTIASLAIFYLLFRFAGPAVKKAFEDRSERIGNELEESSAAKAEAEAEAAEIRQAAGDIDAERQRLFAQADEQADAVLTEGRARLDQEVADIEARAEADIAAAGGRVSDELRAEISRIASAATERVLADGAIDDGTQQQLVESFIQRVGATNS